MSEIEKYVKPIDIIHPVDYSRGSSFDYKVNAWKQRVENEQMRQHTTHDMYCAFPSKAHNTSNAQH